MQTSITKSVTPTSKLIIINILCKKSNIMLFLIIFKIYINTSNVINISIIAIQKKRNHKYSKNILSNNILHS